MERFRLDTDVQPSEPTSLTATGQRSTPWIQQLLECHYYRPAAIAHRIFDRRTTVVEPVAESESVEC